MKAGEFYHHSGWNPINTEGILRKAPKFTLEEMLEFGEEYAQHVTEEKDEEIERPNTLNKVFCVDAENESKRLKKRIQELEEALDASYSILHGDDHVISKEEVIGMIERALTNLL